MTEYITKEQAVDALKETLWDDDFDEFLMHYFELSIKKVKPADVAPVRHGRWTRIDYHDARCSECGHKTYYPDRISLYCPNCGARMGGGADQ